VETLLVFISSTSDLAEEREAVAANLRWPFSAYRYEHDHGRRKSPRDRLVEILDKTDLYVGVLGARYGSLYPNAAEDRSIVEWEFEQASERQKIELFTYCKAVDASAVEPEQRRFLDRVKDFLGGRWAPPFSETSELVQRLLSDLAKFGAEVLLAQREQEVAEEGEDALFAERVARALESQGERYEALRDLARQALESPGEEPGELVELARQELAGATEPALRSLAREAELMAAARGARHSFVGRLRWLAIAALGALAAVAVAQLIGPFFTPTQLLLFAGLIAGVIAGCLVVARL
jgi:catechol 2,3-dioxygenase-like lactoylglutathione lyase family enzyme